RALLTAIRRQVCRSEDARRCLHYFQTNRHRMCYPDFHAQGLCTSTGVVEAGCKVAIGTRLQRAGMHWTVQGSNAIIALRCAKLSGRFQDFWERRTEQRAACLITFLGCTLALAAARGIAPVESAPGGSNPESPTVHPSYAVIRISSIPNGRS